MLYIVIIAKLFLNNTDTIHTVILRISHIGIKFAFEGFRLVHGFADRFAEGRVLSEGRVFGLDLRDAVYPRRFDLLRPIGDGALSVHFVVEDRLRFHRFKVFDVDVFSVL